MIQIKMVFPFKNVELSINGTVDNYFDAQANIIFQIDADGETVVELEEAFMTTRELPWGLQFKAGQYFTEFGRQNTLHPHSWGFADQPVILSRFFGGDGLRSQGMRLSWLTPLNWFSELTMGMQNAKGETVSSFLGEAGEDIAGHELLEIENKGISDLLYSFRWLNAIDIGDTTSMNIGLSALTGPNATGLQTKTHIYGFDYFIKWQSTSSNKGFPFVSVHLELLKRRYEASDVNTTNYELLDDHGGFIQVLWGFKPRWIFGLRYGIADGNGIDLNDPFRNSRKRISANISWYLSEYSKIRLQYNHDRADHLIDRNANSISLQIEFNLGQHMAHIF